MTPELWFAIISLAIGFIGAVFSALASIIAYFVKRGESAQDSQIVALRNDHAELHSDVDGSARQVWPWPVLRGPGPRGAYQTVARPLIHGKIGPC